MACLTLQRMVVSFTLRELARRREAYVARGSGFYNKPESATTLAAREWSNLGGGGGFFSVLFKLLSPLSVHKRARALTVITRVDAPRPVSPHASLAATYAAVLSRKSADLSRWTHDPESGTTRT